MFSGQNNEQDNPFPLELGMKRRQPAQGLAGVSLITLKANSFPPRDSATAENVLSHKCLRQPNIRRCHNLKDSISHLCGGCRHCLVLRCVPREVKEAELLEGTSLS